MEGPRDLGGGLRVPGGHFFQSQAQAAVGVSRMWQACPGDLPVLCHGKPAGSGRGCCGGLGTCGTEAPRRGHGGWLAGTEGRPWTTARVLGDLWRGSEGWLEPQPSLGSTDPSLPELILLRMRPGQARDTFGGICTRWSSQGHGRCHLPHLAGQCL